MNRESLQKIINKDYMQMFEDFNELLCSSLRMMYTHNSKVNKQVEVYRVSNVPEVTSDDVDKMIYTMTYSNGKKFKITVEALNNK